MGETKTNPQRPDKSVPARLMDVLTNVKFAVSVVVLVAVACVVGMLLPQGMDAYRYVQANPSAATRMNLVASLGLTDVFDSRWFVGCWACSRLASRRAARDGSTPWCERMGFRAGTRSVQ
jgi:hypothetical protein